MGGALDPVTPDWSSVHLSPGYGLAAPQPLQNSSFCRSKWRACRSEVGGAGKEGEGKGGGKEKRGGEEETAPSRKAAGPRSRHGHGPCPQKSREAQGRRTLTLSIQT